MLEDGLEEEENRKRKHAQREMMQMMASTATLAVVTVQRMFDEDEEDEENETTVEDHRNLPRGKRKVFDHENTKMCIQRDYTGPEALFGDQFEVYFRISKQRFIRLMEDIKASNNRFYDDERIDAVGKTGVSFEAKLMLPLQTIA